MVHVVQPSDLREPGADGFDKLSSRLEAASPLDFPFEECPRFLREYVGKAISGRPTGWASDAPMHTSAARRSLRFPAALSTARTQTRGKAETCGTEPWGESC